GRSAAAVGVPSGTAPGLAGPVVIGLDVSGSMGSPVTGFRGRGATSKVRCVDVAALFAAALLRRNPGSVVIPFDTAAYKADVDPEDTILNLAARLAAYGGGGAGWAVPPEEANPACRDGRFAGCVVVSDNASWVGEGRHGSTGVLTQWQEFVGRQVRLHDAGFTGPKLVCIDVQSYGTAQAPERS